MAWWGVKFDDESMKTDLILVSGIFMLITSIVVYFASLLDVSIDLVSGILILIGFAILSLGIILRMRNQKRELKYQIILYILMIVIFALLIYYLVGK